MIQHRHGAPATKESAVLDLLHMGMPNKQVARARDMSNETVKRHVKQFLLKPSVGNRTPVVDRARQLGLVG